MVPITEMQTIQLGQNAGPLAQGDDQIP